MPDTYIVFPGLQDMESASVLYQPGIGPSQANISVPAGRVNFNLLTHGDLILVYKNTPAVIWKRAAVESVTFDIADDQTYQITILDRRWMWRYGEISGRYNARDKTTANIAPNAVEKTPRELCTLLLNAMGEQGYDVSQVPEDTRPDIEWDKANPAQELSDLCDKLGVRIVLDYDDKVRLKAVGTGNLFPDIPESLISPSLSVPKLTRPYKFRVYSNVARFETRFELEFVGEDVDGDFKPLRLLSYAPDSAHETGGMDPTHTWLKNGGIPEKAAELAKKTCFRYARIKSPVADLKLDKLFDFKAADIKPEHCKFFDEILVSTADGKFKKAYAIGRFEDSKYAPPNPKEVSYLTPPEKWRRWEGEVSVDSAKKLIIFDKPCFWVKLSRASHTDDWTFETLLAKMYLHTSFQLTLPTFGDYRLWVEQQVPGALVNQAGTEIHMEESIEFAVKHNFAEAAPGNPLSEHMVRTPLAGPAGMTTTLAQSQPELQAVSNHIKKRYDQQIGGTAVYNGIHASHTNQFRDFSLDGIRDMVIWNFGAQQAPRTTLVINERANPYFPLPEERKRNRALDRLVRNLQGKVLQQAIGGSKKEDGK